jgi:hypothetical protein
MCVWMVYTSHHSFGTDSPLDLDIKERLMQQVFRSLAVLPDDEQAYLAHHKAEAGKRLLKNRQEEKKEQELKAAAAAKAASDKKRELLRRPAAPVPKVAEPEAEKVDEVSIQPHGLPRDAACGLA